MRKRFPFHISLDITREMAAELDALADATDRPRVRIIRRAIEQYLEGVRKAEPQPRRRVKQPAGK